VIVVVVVVVASVVVAAATILIIVTLVAVVAAVVAAVLVILVALVVNLIVFIIDATFKRVRCVIDAAHLPTEQCLMGRARMRSMHCRVISHDKGNNIINQSFFCNWLSLSHNS